MEDVIFVKETPNIRPYLLRSTVWSADETSRRLRPQRNKSFGF